GTGLLFDPYSENDISETLQKLYSDKNLRKELQQKSIKRAADFSIQNMSEGFISVFKELK
ncbi:MAG: glycosyltransferase family 1 protein, partial [Patescibacteria group bacterium]